jgi:hypothetical protein
VGNQILGLVLNKTALYSPAMLFGARTFLTLLGLCAFVSLGMAVTADNPYHTIVDRNPFGLNPPVVVNNVPTNDPPKNVKFNGVTKAGGHKRAFFTIPGKDKEPPLYVTLGEGEKADVLEVNKILEDEGEVEVVNAGIKMVLNFKNNGNKGAILAPQPGAPPQPVPIIPQAPPNPANAVFNPNVNNPALAQQPAEGQPNQQPIPSFNANPNGVNPQLAPPPPEGNGGTGMRQIPTRTLRLNPVTPPPPP